MKLISFFAIIQIGYNAESIGSGRKFKIFWNQLKYNFLPKVEYPHCVEYRDILQKYQLLLGEYQQCLTTTSDQRADLRSFSNIITNGLQSQIETIRQDHSSGILWAF